MKLTLADKISLTRLSLMPLAVLFYFLSLEWAYYVSAGLVFLIGVGDILDGYVARSMGQVSRFGAFLDPVIDKICVVTALIILTYHFGSLALTACAVVMTLREVIISALREYMAEHGRRDKVAVFFASKCKTLLQGFAVVFLILASVQFSYPWVYNLGMVLLIASTLLSVLTLIKYLQMALRSFSAQA